MVHTSGHIYGRKMLSTALTSSCINNRAFKQFIYCNAILVDSDS